MQGVRNPSYVLLSPSLGSSHSSPECRHSVMMLLMVGVVRMNITIAAGWRTKAWFTEVGAESSAESSAASSPDDFRHEGHLEGTGGVWQSRFRWV